MTILLSPHDDDNALFASFTCMREKPLVVIVFGSYIQPNRGEIGCSFEERWKETKEACALLDVPCLHLNLRDDTATENDMKEALKKLSGFDKVYAPAIQGGNIHHDMVGRYAKELFDNVVFYPTYTKTELWTKGDKEIIPTREEAELKNKVLECYQSQLRINWVHFEAVLNKSEYTGGGQWQKI